MRTIRYGMKKHGYLRKNNGPYNRLDGAIPQGIAQLKKLKTLHIGGTRNIFMGGVLTQTEYIDNWYIADISVLEKLVNLQSLYLSYNQVSDISVLEKLTNLQSLKPRLQSNLRYIGIGKTDKSSIT